MSWSEYYGKLASDAIKRWDGWVALVTTVFVSPGVGVYLYLHPKMVGTMGFLNWLIPLALFLIGFSFWFLFAPYHHHKEKEKEWEKERNGKLIREKRDYLRLDTGSLLDMVHRKLYHLWLKGIESKGGNDNKMREFDEDVTGLMTEYCHQMTLDIYLANTGRQEEYKPIQRNQLAAAIEEIKRLLDYDTDLRVRFKTSS